MKRKKTLSGIAPADATKTLPIMVTPPHIPGTKKTFVMCLQKNKQSIPNPYSKQYKSGIENPVHKKSRMAYETQTYANWQTANSKAKNEEIAVLQKKGTCKSPPCAAKTKLHQNNS